MHHLHELHPVHAVEELAHRRAFRLIVGLALAIILAAILTELLDGWRYGTGLLNPYQPVVDPFTY